MDTPSGLEAFAQRCRRLKFVRRQSVSGKPAAVHTRCTLSIRVCRTGEPGGSLVESGRARGMAATPFGRGSPACGAPAASRLVTPGHGALGCLSSSIFKAVTSPRHGRARLRPSRGARRQQRALRRHVPRLGRKPRPTSPPVRICIGQPRLKKELTKT